MIEQLLLVCKLSKCMPYNLAICYCCIDMQGRFVLNCKQTESNEYILIDT